jgi:type I restriction enzyme S subunit
MEGKWIHPQREGVTSTAIQNAKARKVAAGSLMMSFKLTIGRVGFAGVDLYPNEAIVAIDVDANISTKGFLYLVLGSQDLTHGSGRAIKGATLNSASLAAIPLLLPPIAEQKRIVDVMASVDAYIAALQQQAVDAQAARNAVLHELLTAGGVDWAETTLGETVAIIRDRLDPASCDPAEIFCHWSIPALDETGGPVTVPASQIGSHKFRVEKNAVAYSLLNPRLPRYVLIQGGENVVCSTEFAVMQPKSGMDESFLYVLASSSEFQMVVGTFASGTTKSRERVRPADLEQIQIRLPPLSEQKRIVGIVSAMDNVTGAAQEAVSNSQELRSGLLSELLSGDHEIPETYDRLLGAG